MARKLHALAADPSPHILDLAGLGIHVRNQRVRHGLRIDDAAALCGVSADVLSRLENGKAITVDRLLLVLQGLGLHLFAVPASLAHATEASIAALAAPAEPLP